ncbi:hypothetical protein [Croceibacterium aestuarii]|uniref:hypothetical protein n=1 Tax=Croceibacterium aestuarii TaxID=3064139 RepID=UPI00272E6B14|nr:hypothetical protein [Croceibacterium sp. D39]
MNPPEFILIIVLAGMGLSAWKIKHGYGRYGRRDRGYDVEQAERLAQSSAREKELQREVEDLRERVKVLERIATDDRGSRLLADEIDKLRDK